MRTARAGLILVGLSIATGLVVVGATPRSANAFGSAGCPTADPCVNVALPGGGAQVVTGPTMASWISQASGAPDAVVDKQYPLKAPGQDPTPGNIVTGLSINALVADVLGEQSQPIDPSTVTYVQITRPDDGSLLSLDKGQIAVPSTYPDDLNFNQNLLPVLYLDGNDADQIAFARPLSSDSDANAQDDEIQTTEDGALQVRIGTGQILVPSVTVSDRTPKQGEVVTFTASLTGAAGTFEWNFGDGSPTVAGATVRHAFTTANSTFEVLVQASGPGDSAGAAPPIYITVGHPDTRPGPTKSPGGGSGTTHGSSPHRPPDSKDGASPKTPNHGDASATPASKPGVADTAEPQAGPSIPSRDQSQEIGQSRATSPEVADGSTLPLVRGQLVGAGALIDASQVVGTTTRASGPATGPTGVRRAVSGAAGITAILLLLGWGARRELRRATSS